MKKSIAVALLLGSALFSLPAFADDANNGQAQVKNVQSGSRNTATGWVEVLDATHEEAAKGKSTGE